MLKKMLYKKIAVASSLLLILFLLYLVPTNNMEVEIKNQEVEYVSTNTLNEVYLLNEDNYLTRTCINVFDEDKSVIMKNLVDTLTIDGKKKDIIPKGFHSLIPKNTKLLWLELKDNILYLNFSKEFYNIGADIENKVIETLIYTLTSIDGIDKIQIKIDGVVLNELPHSKKKLPEYLDKSYGINKQYLISTLSDVDSYTIYYVSNINNQEYYVPVTKYLDSKQDKIKVIIDELATSLIYGTNLMSFLDTNVKLLNYEINDDNVMLNFSSDILTDISNDKILEEVVYTVGLSIREEFNVKEVIFYVNNEKISTFS